MSSYTYWFKHDYHARHHKKIHRIFKKHGATGVGVLWCVIEQLYENDGEMFIEDIFDIAHELKVEVDMVEDIILKSGVFQSSDTKFWNIRVSEAIEKMIEQRIKNTRAANIRHGNV